MHVAQGIVTARGGMTSAPRAPRRAVSRPPPGPGLCCRPAKRLPPSVLHPSLFFFFKPYFRRYFWYCSLFQPNARMNAIPVLTHERRAFFPFLQLPSSTHLAIVVRAIRFKSKPCSVCTPQISRGFFPTTVQSAPPQHFPICWTSIGGGPCLTPILHPRKTPLPAPPPGF